MDLFITVATQFRKWAKLISYISQWETGCWVSLWGWIKAGNLLTERERERYLVKKWNTGEMLIKKKIKKKRWREKRCLCKIAVRRVKVNQKGFTPAVCDVSPPKGFQLGPVCSSLFFYHRRYQSCRALSSFRQGQRFTCRLCAVSRGLLKVRPDCKRRGCRQHLHQSAASGWDQMSRKFKCSLPLAFMVAAVWHRLAPQKRLIRCAF